MPIFNPEVLFNTLNPLGSAVSSDVPVFSNSDCNTFSNYFVEKVRNARSSIVPSSSRSVSDSSSSAHLDSFSPVSLERITALLSRMKPSSRPAYVLPTSLCLNVFNSVGS